MDYNKLAELLFPNVQSTPEELEKKYPPRELPEGAVVSRLAPSPTGFIHLGNILQAMTSERMCHRTGGVYFLRVEDTDQKREVPGAVNVLLDSMSHYNIHFDEGATADGDSGSYGPYRQRSRAEIYHVYAKKLVAEGKAYPCFCSEDELTAMREKQEAEKVDFGYYGEFAVWRDRSIEDIEKAISNGEQWVLRFRSTGNIANKLKFNDMIKGTVDITENDKDMVLLKSDGIPTYHFAHAVDDHLMRTTLVVRGDEWLASLPFHIQLFGALGFKLPKYAHIGPLMIMDGSSKRKVSKRKDPEFGLIYYTQNGFPVNSVREYLLTLLNSNFEDWRRANPDAPIEDFPFSIKKMNPAGSLFDSAKLNDVSKNVVSKMTAEDVLCGLIEWAREFDTEFYELLNADMSFAKSIISIGRGGKKPRKDYGTWVELKAYMELFYDKYFEIADAYPENARDSDIIATLKSFSEMYDGNDDQNAWFEKIKCIADRLGYASDMKEFKAFPEKFKGSVADISMFLRVAVTGKLNSPDMYSVMQILGTDKVRERINNMIERLA